MANKNRIEVSAAIQALSAIVGETEHKQSLDDNFAQSVVFRKDVSASETANSSSYTLDFTDIDYIEVDQSSISSVRYSFTGIFQGEIKFLKVIKIDVDPNVILFNTSYFVNTPDNQYITNELQEVMYMIINKDGDFYVILLTPGIITSTEDYQGIVQKATDSNALAGINNRNITADLMQGILKASNAEVLAGSLSTKWVSPSSLAAKDGGLLTTVLDIGDWNMDSTPSKDVTHGLTLSKIRDVSVMIRDDSATTQRKLESAQLATNTVEGSVWTITSTQVRLNRVSGGIYDNTNYNSTGFNRGWVIIKHTP